MVLTYARIFSLEIPSLALSLVAIYFFLRYLQGAGLKDGILAAIFTGLALLTKQTSVFLPVFYGIVLG
jgi:4-amino-4-deoxy-L-arabinose transferase-like glycosyltransferase